MEWFVIETGRVYHNQIILYTISSQLGSSKTEFRFYMVCGIYLLRCEMLIVMFIVASLRLMAYETDNPSIN
jgi:hypothetical protein